MARPFVMLLAAAVIAESFEAGPWLAAPIVVLAFRVRLRLFGVPPARGVRKAQHGAERCGPPCPASASWRKNSLFLFGKC